MYLVLQFCQPCLDLNQPLHILNGVKSDFTYIDRFMPIEHDKTLFSCRVSMKLSNFKISTNLFSQHLRSIKGYFSLTFIDIIQELTE